MPSTAPVPQNARMKLIFGAVLSAVVLFVYGFVSFAVLPWHEPRDLKDDSALTQAIRNSVTEDGVYMVPGRLRPDGSHLDEEQWMKASEQGPFMLAMIRPGGSRRPMISYFAANFVYNVALALLLALILRQISADFFGTVGAAALIGLFAGLSNWLPASNWYEYPPVWWVPYVVDGVLQGILAGSVLAPFIRRKSA